MDLRISSKQILPQQVTTKVHHTETRELSWCHLCCHWWHWRLSSRQPPVPPITTKLLLWQLLVFIHHNPVYPNTVANRCQKQAYPWAITLPPPDPWLSILQRSGAPDNHTLLYQLNRPSSRPATGAYKLVPGHLHIHQLMNYIEIASSFYLNMSLVHSDV